MSCQFHYAGHILGAASISIRLGGRTILFSGDVGRPQDPLFFAPDVPSPMDYLVVESTYGDRSHPAIDPQMELAQVIHRTVERGGIILIPAFTVGRTQSLLYYLWKLRSAGLIPDIPMYLNSPMATHVTDAVCRFSRLHKLSTDECEELRHVVKFVESAEESRALNARKGPMLIISASGMATGGRILHHLKEFAPGAKNCILLAGFQAAATRGRSLLS